MAAIFFAILALLAIWGTFLLNATGNLTGFTFSVVTAISLTAFIAVLAGSWFAFKKLKARAASKELDKTLNAQADDQEAGARPDLQPQIKEMRAEFQKAVGSLKSSRLGRSGADALSVMPWYVIIGPPGTGKSTALRNSGLKFPYLGKKGGVRGVGGTRNCDWWLTNEGVILDTAGRYVTEEDDQEEWLSFLDAVAKSRPRRPINGLIVTVAASELITLDEAGAAALGSQLRERVDEVTGRLHLVVPVYLLVTKCDLLSGFVETFANLPKSERGQVWGFTYPVGASHEDGPSEMVREKLDELTDVLFERAAARLAQERKMEAREKIFRFPRQLQLLRAALGEVS
jgi:type VI secretion system protein ImpL